MATYFGVCNSDGTKLVAATGANSDGGIAFWCDAVCPGSGLQDIVEFGVFMDGVTSTATTRMAVYNSAGTTLIQQSTTISVPNIGGAGAETWYSDLTTYSGVLTGGTTYRVAWTVGGAVAVETNSFAPTASLPNDALKSIDYTGGFPASLPAPDATNPGMYTVRVGVVSSETITADKWLGYSVVPPPAKTLLLTQLVGPVPPVQPLDSGARPSIIMPSGYYRRNRILPT